MLKNAVMIKSTTNAVISRESVRRKPGSLILWNTCSSKIFMIGLQR